MAGFLAYRREYSEVHQNTGCRPARATIHHAHQVVSLYAYALRYRTPRSQPPAAMFIHFFFCLRKTSAEETNDMREPRLRHRAGANTRQRAVRHAACSAPAANSGADKQAQRIADSAAPHHLLMNNMFQHEIRMSSPTIAVVDALCGNIAYDATEVLCCRPPMSFPPPATLSAICQRCFLTLLRDDSIVTHRYGCAEQFSTCFYRCRQERAHCCAENRRRPATNATLAPDMIREFIAASRASPLYHAAHSEIGRCLSSPGEQATYNMPRHTVQKVHRQKPAVSVKTNKWGDKGKS